MYIHTYIHAYTHKKKTHTHTQRHTRTHTHTSELGRRPDFSEFRLCHSARKKDDSLTRFPQPQLVAQNNMHQYVPNMSQSLICPNASLICSNMSLSPTHTYSLAHTHTPAPGNAAPTATAHHHADTAGGANTKRETAHTQGPQPVRRDYVARRVPSPPAPRSGRRRAG